jgi:tetratricopeptide (TPR) repeat protein
MQVHDSLFDGKKFENQTPTITPRAMHAPRMALLRDLLPAFVCLFGACALGLDVGTCPPITSKTAGRVGLGLPAGLAAAGPRPDRASLLQRRTLVPLLHVPCGVRLRGGGTSSIDAAVDLKNRGNAMFREGKFDEAKTMYDAALDSLPKGESANRERANCHNNRAACHVKLGDFVRCVEDCTAVLDIDPPNGTDPLLSFLAPLLFFQPPPSLILLFSLP